MRNFGKIKGTLLVTILSVSFSTFVFSASLSLTKIGSLGTAADGSQVSVKVGETTNAVNVTSGAWSYDFTGENKDYNIEISQGSEKISFVLHLGQTLPNNVTAGSSPQSEGVPETGYNQIIAISLGVGIVLLASYFYFWGDSKKKTVFEARMIRED